MQFSCCSLRFRALCSDLVGSVSTKPSLCFSLLCKRLSFRIACNTIGLRDKKLKDEHN